MVTRKNIAFIYVMVLPMACLIIFEGWPDRLAKVPDRLIYSSAGRGRAILEENNLRIDSAWIGIPPNASTPFSQLEPIRFLAGVENAGTAIQTNVLLTVSVIDEEGDLVFFSETGYGDLSPGSVVKDRFLPETYRPERSGTFFGIYALSADQVDADTSDNIREFAFVVSDTAFTKEFGPEKAYDPDSSNWGPEERHSAAYGNYFFVTDSRDLSGNELFFTSISFSIVNSDEIAGQELSLAVYRWPEDVNQNGMAEPDERQLTGVKTYQVKGTERPPEIINVPFPGDDAQMVALEDSMAYLIMLEYTPPDTALQKDLVMAFSDALNYEAMQFAARQDGKPRYASMGAFAGDLAGATFVKDPLGADQIPVVRLNVTSSSSRREVTASPSQFQAYPNPTSGWLYLHLTSPDLPGSARILLYDLSGRPVFQKKYDIVFDEVLEVDLSGLPSGAYFLELITGRGRSSKRILLMR